jgi:hypothetical protein
VRALEACGRFRHVQVSAEQHANRALFSWHGKIYPRFLNLGLSKKVVAHFIERFTLDELGSYKNSEKGEADGQKL